MSACVCVMVIYMCVYALRITLIIKISFHLRSRARRHTSCMVNVLPVQCVVSSPEERCLVVETGQGSIVLVVVYMDSRMLGTVLLPHIIQHRRTKLATLSHNEQVITWHCLRTEPDNQTQQEASGSNPGLQCAIIPWEPFTSNYYHYI